VRAGSSSSAGGSSSSSSTAAGCGCRPPIGNIHGAPLCEGWGVARAAVAVGSFTAGPASCMDIS
jgi:hypothetical protein